MFSQSQSTPHKVLLCFPCLPSSLQHPLLLSETGHLGATQVTLSTGGEGTVKSRGSLAWLGISIALHSPTHLFSVHEPGTVLSAGYPAVNKTDVAPATGSLHPVGRGRKYRHEQINNIITACDNALVENTGFQAPTLEILPQVAWDGALKSVLLPSPTGNQTPRQM